jgi:hypothetical protein
MRSVKIFFEYFPHILLYQSFVVWKHGKVFLFGQVRTDEKSNEITAIPSLLVKKTTFLILKRIIFSV